jgi:hypothetical protein
VAAAWLDGFIWVHVLPWLGSCCSGVSSHPLCTEIP